MPQIPECWGEVRGGGVAPYVHIFKPSLLTNRCEELLTWVIFKVIYGAIMMMPHIPLFIVKMWMVWSSKVVTNNTGMSRAHHNGPKNNMKNANVNSWMRNKTVNMADRWWVCSKSIRGSLWSDSRSKPFRWPLWRLLLAAGPSAQQQRRQWARTVTRWYK